LSVGTTVGIDIDIRRIMFVFDWFVANIVDRNFAWSDFNPGVYTADKRLRSAAKLKQAHRQ
jgi:hypothetical protein